MNSRRDVHTERLIFVADKVPKFIDCIVKYTKSERKWLLHLVIFYRPLNCIMVPNILVTSPLLEQLYKVMHTIFIRFSFTLPFENARLKTCFSAIN